MQQHIVLTGAGSANFGLGTLGDVLRSKVPAGSKVTLHDINPTALQRVEADGAQVNKCFGGALRLGGIIIEPANSGAQHGDHIGEGIQQELMQRRHPHVCQGEIELEGINN